MRRIVRWELAGLLALLALVALTDFAIRGCAR